MKKKIIIKAVAIFFVAGIFVGCKNVNPDKDTVANLKTSLISEYYTSARYNAFSDKAEKEGYMQIAKLFKALSVAESVHARNFKNILDSAGVKTDNVVPGFLVGSTEINLENAIKEEIMDIDSIYPGYIKQSNNSPLIKANQTFSSVWEAEKTHKDLLVMIYDILMTNLIKVNEVAVTSAPASENLVTIGNLFSKTNYYVCPVDGRVFDSTDITDKCSLCTTPRSNFIIIN